MTEQKMYYDDPLAAAYMAREFGVLFNCEGIYGSGRSAAPCITFYQKSFFESDKVTCSIIDNHKYIIHPDSYPIFEPQEGDIVTYNYKGRGHYGVEWLDRKHSDWDRFQEDGAHSEVEIIRRSGKPFFPPKKEGV